MELIPMDKMRNRIVEAQAEENGQWSYKLTDVISPKALCLAEDTFINTEKDEDIREAKKKLFQTYMNSVVKMAVMFGYKKCIEHMNEQ